jgi:hypothetical protein
MKTIFRVSLFFLTFASTLLAGQQRTRHLHRRLLTVP